MDPVELDLITLPYFADHRPAPPATPPVNNNAEEQYSAFGLSPWTRGKNIKHRGALVLDL